MMLIYRSKVLISHKRILGIIYRSSIGTQYRYLMKVVASEANTHALQLGGRNELKNELSPIMYTYTENYNSTYI